MRVALAARVPAQSTFGGVPIPEQSRSHSAFEKYDAIHGMQAKRNALVDRMFVWRDHSVKLGGACACAACEDFEVELQRAVEDGR